MRYQGRARLGEGARCAPWLLAAAVAACIATLLLAALWLPLLEP